MSTLISATSRHWFAEPRVGLSELAPGGTRKQHASAGMAAGDPTSRPTGLTRAASTASWRPCQSGRFIQPRCAVRRARAHHGSCRRDAKLSATRAPASHRKRVLRKESTRAPPRPRVQHGKCVATQDAQCVAADNTPKPPINTFSSAEHSSLDYRQASRRCATTQTSSRYAKFHHLARAGERTTAQALCRRVSAAGPRRRVLSHPPHVSAKLAGGARVAPRAHRRRARDRYPHHPGKHVDDTQALVRDAGLGAAPRALAAHSCVRAGNPQCVQAWARTWLGQAAGRVLKHPQRLLTTRTSACPAALDDGSSNSCWKA